MDEQQRLWSRAQLTNPQAIYSVGDLSILSGLSKKVVRNYLRAKGVLPEVSATKRGETEFVEFNDLTTKAAGFWNSIQKRIIGGIARA